MTRLFLSPSSPSYFLLATMMLCLLVLCSACSTPGTGTAFLQNLQGCERHYNGVVRAGIVGSGFDGSIRVDCKPSAAAPQTQDPQPTALTPAI